MELRLNNKQVVNCQTEEEIEQYFNVIKKINYMLEPLERLRNCWDEYKDKTCFRIKFNTVFCALPEDCKGCQLLSVQDFLTMHSVPFMGYFESDGTKETGSKILAVLKVLGGKNKYNYTGDAPMCDYLIDKNGEIECHCIMKKPTNYSKCNLDHYLHLIDTDLNKDLDEGCIKAQNEEIIKLKAQIEELKIKADKWDATPQLFCIRGKYKRGDDVKKRLKDVIQKDSHTLNQYQYNQPEAIYFVNTMNNSNSINKVYDYSPMGQLLLATQTITELPPLEAKDEVEEFYIKPFDKILCNDNVGDAWGIDIFSSMAEIGDDTVVMTPSGHYARFIPFTAETEPLIGTTTEPTKKYKFMGVKPYFNQE